MLDYLRIRGLALLDDVALEFEPGMNVLTGETGAGKSIIVDALTLLRGGRGRAELVREGDETARVEAQFAVRGRIGAPAGIALDEILDQFGLALEDEALVLERRIRRSGRGRVAIQSNLSTLAAITEIGSELIEICSQHEHHSLTHVAHHLELLDAYAQLDGAEGPLADYAGHYRGWRALTERIAEIREQEAERLSRADYLRFQIDELERASLEPGEYEQLRARLGVLRGSHELAGFANQAQSQLYEDDNAVASVLAVLLERARRLPEGLTALAEITEQLEAAQIACEEAASAAARLADEIEVGPNELEHTQERLHELERLRRKHGCDVDELIERTQSMHDELVALDSAEDELAQLEQLESKQWAAVKRHADTLHAARVAAASGLARAIEAELDALHIPNAKLSVELRAVEAGADPSDAPDPSSERCAVGPRGRDRAELRFSANPGEPLAPLNKVASGGELSRVLLAVKSVLSTRARVATYVFDEVDAGVGGAVAEAIGLRLRRAASNHQILCITHLPQIAAYAQAHFRVRKLVVDGRTVTRVERLDADERVEELARMLGGKRVTQSAREHARALLEQALVPTPPAGKPPVAKPGKSTAKTTGKTTAKTSGKTTGKSTAKTTGKTTAKSKPRRANAS
ncbi:DNA repair protein RecN [Enhygromyxa salina]|uniref:DNA repair protein RecN n=1 Tax=Enhygromyxa salina TaxID=215803 RepID=A0A0C2D520_9BACT|nr:DNA repair protein RecN [Enhygromyxa salina]KIG15147.1 DNA repair protein RecN [Enhygromyxa salina]